MPLARALAFLVNAPRAGLQTELDAFFDHVLDGTSLRVPDVPECVDHFGGMATSFGRFRPLARASALFDAARGCFCQRPAYRIHFVIGV